MKKLILAIVVLSLQGCALVDAYLMTHYDPNEYKIITEIRSEARSYKANCSDIVISKVNATALADKTQLFEIYNEQIPRNAEGISASKNLNEIAQGLKNRYASGNTVSATFCKIKFESIEKSAELIQHVVANRPR